MSDAAEDARHVEEATRRAALGLHRRFGRDAALIALHNRQRARALGAEADVRAWERIQRAVLELEERAADTAWGERGEERRNFTRLLARHLAQKG
jgi:hypothetical protein